ncbi:MAG: type II toxin-antitoxin system RelE/ParE family toxin [Syntrophobacteraceae bacterium]|nr:type II toxin-antitoxin system RelE/ParE family toxin [Syntrophobacteraceae bacterium]
MKILWSRQARDDLLDIYRYIFAENPGAARALHKKIVSGVLALLETPQIGRPGRVPGTREVVIPGVPYIVPYRISGEILQILRVYHYKRLWPDSFD